jgi:peptidoglycan/LPS O-acetylase OafA/YrhL
MRNQSFDIIRILAVTLVIASHNGIPAIGPMATGGLGVTLFLLISGLLLAVTDRGEVWPSFVFRRIKRIYPTYWLCLLTSILITWKLPNDTVEAILLVTGTCAFAGRWGCSVLNTSWFIGLIMALYAFYPILKRAIDANPLLSLVTLYALSLFMQRRGILWLGLKGDAEWWFPLCRVFEFSLGIALAPRLNSFAPCLSPAWMQYVAELSFPTFLLHWPLLSWGLPLPAYLIVLLLLSAVIIEALRLWPYLWHQGANNVHHSLPPPVPSVTQGLRSTEPTTCVKSQIV